jgi:hypothetical protein
VHRRIFLHDPALEAERSRFFSIKPKLAIVVHQDFKPARDSSAEIASRGEVYEKVHKA